jgi:Protein of unknown function (DUF3800)
MFNSYFDESWDQHQEKILVVGGMLGLYEQWSKIEWRWTELLDKYGIAYYRASEAEFARGQFNKEPYRTVGTDTTPQQYDLLRAVREDFFRITTSGTVSGLAIGIPVALFREVADTPERLEKFGGTPYYLCGHTAVLEMLKAVKYVLRSKDIVTFTFDRQQEHEKEMKKVHAHLQTKECEFHSQVGSIKFEDKKLFIPLQAADTLVYESRKYLERLLADPAVRPRPELQRLMDEGKIFQISLTDKAFLEFYLNH